MVSLSEEMGRKRIQKKVREEFRKQGGDQEYLDTEPLYKQLKGLGKEAVKTAFDAVIETSIQGSPIQTTCKTIWKIMN